MHIRRTSALVLCAAALLQGQGTEAEPKKASLSGVVVDEKTGEPVRKVTVFVRRRTGGGTGTITGADGKFLLVDVDTETSFLNVERDGYVATRETQQRTVSPKPGETIRDLTLKVVRTGSISGRVMDADGEPVNGVGINVLPLKAGWDGIKRVGYASTNDRGEYRAYNIAPGQYRISATYTSKMQQMDIRMQGAAANSSAVAYPVVYYPGTLDMNQGVVVDVEPAAELEGFDLRLSPVRAVRVRGRVSGHSEVSAPVFVVVALEPVRKHGDMPSGQMRHTVVQDPKGDFVLTDVLPGSYRISARAGGFNDESRLSARRNLDVGESDIDGVHLNVAGPVKVSGRVIVPEGRKVPQQLMVVLGSRDQGDSQAGGMAHVEADGAFTLKSVTPGDYHVMLATTGKGDDLYISAINVDDTDALSEAVHVGDRPASAMNVFLKPNGGTVVCSVKNEKGESVAGANILLIPEGSPGRQAALFSHCNTAGDGSCSIQGITPGAYHAYAVPEISIDHRDPDALKPFEKYRKVVKFAEGEKHQLELTLAPME